jgi:hypothetical protein
VRSAYIIDRRAGSSVLAVQAMPVEEYEVRHETPFDCFIYPEKSFHRCSGAALCLRVQGPNADRARGLVDHECALGRRARSVLLLSAGCLRFAPGLLAFAVPGDRPTRSAPPLLDFRHPVTDNQLRM